MHERFTIMLCGKFHCQKGFGSKLLPYKISQPISQLGMSVSASFEAVVFFITYPIAAWCADQISQLSQISQPCGVRTDQPTLS